MNLKMKDVMTANCQIPNAEMLTSNHCAALARELNNLFSGALAAQRDEGLAREAEMERENRLLRHDCASFLETMAKTCDLLGIDAKSAQNAQGKPSDVLYEHANDLQQRLADADQKIDDAADLLRRAKQMIPVLQCNWHANTDALLASPDCADGEKP